ncbi:MAG: glycosyltransferase family A protein [Acidobacteriota bacterium]
MNAEPRVSVVIPTFNRAHQVYEAIESALAQTWRAAEVIVVDDGSTDNTREVVARYRDRVRYIYQENRGVSAARNAGIRIVQGSHIAFLDSDDLWVPGKLEAQMALFAEHPELGLVSCHSRFVDVHGVPTQGDPSAIEPPIAEGRPLLRRLLLGNWLSGGSNAVVRRAPLDAVGGFDERLSCAEDWDMWIRIAQRFAIGFVNEPLTISRVSANSLSAPANVAAMLENELRMLDKHCSAADGGVGSWDRRMAYAERYGRAAWAHLAIGNRRLARRFIIKSLAVSPEHFVTQRGFVLSLMRVMVGERTFEFAKRHTGRRNLR